MHKQADFSPTFSITAFYAYFKRMQKSSPHPNFCLNRVSSTSRQTNVWEY